ncbi:MAG TPA: orotidine-5'-phosphate decarboxylase [Planctomycetota bacterium]|nr:orotidine-5'-phosphate decarboxylase [Planctomycetota bacterium]
MPSSHFADRLIAAVERARTPLCVGIDPRLDQLPTGMLERHIAAHPGEPLAAAGEALYEFSSRVLEAVAGEVGVVKIQNAFFEQAGAPGLDAFCRTVRRARELGLIAISDAKRADIGSTSAGYATAHLGAISIGGAEVEVIAADALTVNPYFGSDGVAPFIEEAVRRGRGIFVLVKTSNPSSSELQDLSCGSRPVYERLADRVWEWARVHLGESGYSAVGAVVGATFPQELAKLRAEMPGAIFLVPGFGAQGGKAENTMAAFDEKRRGAVINSSREIIFAYRKPQHQGLPAQRFEEAVLSECRSAKAKLAAALAAR